MSVNAKRKPADTAICGRCGRPMWKPALLPGETPWPCSTCQDEIAREEAQP